MLRSNITTSVIWSVGSRFSGKIIDFFTLLILARVLSPSDFGLVAIAVSFIAVFETILEIPTTQVLLRIKVISKDFLDTAFTLNVIKGAFLSVILISISLPISKVYEDQRLCNLILWLSIAPISRSLYSPGIVLFMKRLSFREIFATEFIGKLSASIISVALLAYGSGYWSIAVATIVSPLITTLSSFMIAPYRPRISLSKMGDFSSFIGWFSLSQAISAVNWQFDRMILGAYINKTLLGQFTMASDLAVLPTQSLIGPAMRPVMASLSIVVDDKFALGKTFKRYLLLTMMAAIPVGVGMSVNADLIVLTLLGSKWVDVAPLLSWLSLIIVPYAYFQPISTLAVLLNKPSYIFYYSFCEIILKSFLVPLAIYYDGISGLLVGRSIISFAMLLVSSIILKKLMPIGLLSQLKNVLSLIMSSMLMIVGVLIVRSRLESYGFSSLSDLFISSLVGCLVYFSSLYVFRIKNSL